MAENTNPKFKFGVVHGTPTQLATATIKKGKLYFISGEESDGIKQGIYGVDPLATGDYNTLALFGTGAVANGVGYGLSQANFTTEEKNKLGSLSNYILPDASNDVLGGIKTNYSQNGKNYAIKVDSSGNAYVNVPWIDKPADASHADSATNASTAEVANKVAKKLYINGIDFDGSKDVSLLVKGDGKTIDVSTLDSSVVIKAITGDVSNDSSALTTGAQVASYVSTQLGNLSGALLYKGTVANATELNGKDKTSGHVWISSTKDWEYTDVNGTKYAIEVGDMFICNGTGWNIVSSEFDVSTYSNELQWGTDVSIAVVDGVTIKAKLPANPNTDEKVKANTSDGKFYLIGQDDATNGTTEIAYKNASVYVEGGYLYSGNAKVLTSYTEKYTGTVTSITAGKGLTTDATENAITSTGTLNLKIASSTEIGGVKPGITNGKTYGVQVNASTGEMTVNVPWTDNNDNTWRDVYVGGTQRLATGINSGSLKFVDSTNIKATWDSSNKTIQFDASGLATTTQVEEATIYWETL